MSFCLKRSHSWDANNFSPTQEILRKLCNPEIIIVFTRVRLFVHILSHTNPVHTLQSWFFNIHFNILPFTPSSFSWSLTFTPIKMLYSFLIFPCTFAPPPISFSLFGLPEYLLRTNHDALLYALFSRFLLFTVSYPQFSSAPYSRTTLAYVLPLMTDQSSHRCKTTGCIVFHKIVIFVALDSK